MNIRSALQMCKQVIYLKSVVKQHSDLLATGGYKISGNLRTAILNCAETCEKASPYFYRHNTGKWQKLLAKVLNKVQFIKNSKKNSHGEYEVVYTANNFDKIREIKLFSFKSKKILTFCTSSEEMKKQLHQYELYSNSYNMPRIMKSDYNANSYEIAMVDILPFTGELEAMRTISSATANAHDVNCISKSALVSEIVDISEYDSEMSQVLTELLSQIDDLLKVSTIPICVQHGDLSKENLIYGSSEGIENYWFIDWEHAGERIFFYDLFFYIINSAMYYNDEALQLYLDGKVDIILNELFERHGFLFDPKYRKDYLLIFMVVFLKERVCAHGNVSALLHYYELIKRYISL